MWIPRGWRVWFGEVEALPGVAAQGLQLLTLCAGLDAFGDDVPAQSVGQPDHCVTMAWLPGAAGSSCRAVF